jgi:O-antigen/teichoic acid export membrane protein
MIKKIYKQVHNAFFKSEFNSNVQTLMTGTTIAQAIQIAIIPILTRIYSPTEFGIAAIYFSCLSVLALIATGRYELAITLPGNDKDAAHMVMFTLKLSLLISIFFYLPIFFFGNTLALWIDHPNLEFWFYLLPVSVFITTSFNVFQFWCNRKSQYSAMAVNRVQNSLFASLSTVALGFSKISGGLIFGRVLGHALTSWLIWRRVWARNYSLLSTTTKKREQQLAKRYITHPKHIVPAQLLGVIAQQIPIFMIGSVYSLSTLGFFSLAYSLVIIPSSLVANAIGDVYRQRISAAYNERGEFRSIFISTFKKLILLALPPFVIMYFIAPLVFKWVLDSNWSTAGEYAQILVFGAYFQFIFTPIDKGALVVGATRYILAWHFARLLFLLMLFFSVKSYEINIEYVLWTFVFFNSLLYFIDGFMGYRLTSRVR